MNGLGYWLGRLPKVLEARTCRETDFLKKLSWGVLASTTPCCINLIFETITMYHPISHAQRKNNPQFSPNFAEPPQRLRQVWAHSIVSLAGFFTSWRKSMKIPNPKGMASHHHITYSSRFPKPQRRGSQASIVSKEGNTWQTSKKLRGFRYQRGFDLLIHLAQVDVAPLSRWRGGKSRHTSMNSWRLWNHSRFEMCKGHNNLCELQLHIMTYYDCILFPHVQHMNNSFLLPPVGITTPSL